MGHRRELEFSAEFVTVSGAEAPAGANLPTRKALAKPCQPTQSGSLAKTVSWTPRTPSALAWYHLGVASRLQARCLGVARVLLSYSLRVSFVFSSYSLGILLLYSPYHPVILAASHPRGCRVMATYLDTQPGRVFISRFSVSRFGLVSLHDVDRANDSIG
jgi:hypothetical protein